jgi:hypothetical protein
VQIFIFKVPAMRKIGACIGIAALTLVTMSPTPSPAFGLRLGPLYIGVPFFGFRHRHRMATLHDEAPLNPVDKTSAVTSPLLYPSVALPIVFDEIFSPSSAAWPYSYDAIFRAAFANTRPDETARGACQPPARQSVFAERIRDETRPTGDQVQLLQKLGGALAFAGDYLAKACPADVPSEPAARLQLMEWQTEKLAQALEFVRQPLSDFQQSLNDTQRARFAAPASSAAATAGHPGQANIAPTCAATPTKVDASFDQISLSVQPTDAQHEAMNNLKQALHNAASELDANCPAAMQPVPLARLEATQARLDATWRALVAIQTALANLETGLSSEQRARLDATDFAAAQ